MAEPQPRPPITTSRGTVISHEIVQVQVQRRILGIPCGRRNKEVVKRIHRAEGDKAGT